MPKRIITIRGNTAWRRVVSVYLATASASRESHWELYRAIQRHLALSTPLNPLCSTDMLSVISTREWSVKLKIYAPLLLLTWLNSRYGVKATLAKLLTRLSHDDAILQKFAQLPIQVPTNQELYWMPSSIDVRLLFCSSFAHSSISIRAFDLFSSLFYLFSCRVFYNSQKQLYIEDWSKIGFVYSDENKNEFAA